MEAANEDKAVVQYPAPCAFFNGFGDSALNFELRVYLLDLDNWFIYGRLYQAIERKLREAGVTIPFPQRDLHLRGEDQPLPTAPVPPPEKHLRLVDQKDKQKDQDEEEKIPPDLGGIVSCALTGSRRLLVVFY